MSSRVRVCAAVNCDGQDKHMFKWPTGAVGEVWTRFVSCKRAGKKNGAPWKPNSNSYLCYRHFTPDMFGNYGQYCMQTEEKMRLQKNKGAIPTIQLQRGEFEQLESPRKVNPKPFTAREKRVIINDAVRSPFMLNKDAIFTIQCEAISSLALATTATALPTTMTCTTSCTTMASTSSCTTKTSSTSCTTMTSTTSCTTMTSTTVTPIFSFSPFSSVDHSYYMSVAEVAGDPSSRLSTGESRNSTSTESTPLSEERVVCIEDDVEVKIERLDYSAHVSEQAVTSPDLQPVVEHGVENMMAATDDVKSESSECLELPTNVEVKIERLDYSAHVSEQAVTSPVPLGVMPKHEEERRRRKAEYMRRFRAKATEETKRKWSVERMVRKQREEQRKIEEKKKRAASQRRYKRYQAKLKASDNQATTMNQTLKTCTCGVNEDSTNQTSDSLYVNPSDQESVEKAIIEAVSKAVKSNSLVKKVILSYLSPSTNKRAVKQLLGLF